MTELKWGRGEAEQGMGQGSGSVGTSFIPSSTAYAIYRFGSQLRFPNTPTAVTSIPSSTLKPVTSVLGALGHASLTAFCSTSPQGTSGARASICTGVAVWGRGFWVNPAGVELWVEHWQPWRERRDRCGPDQQPANPALLRVFILQRR